MQMDAEQTKLKSAVISDSIQMYNIIEVLRTAETYHLSCCQDLLVTHPINVTPLNPDWLTPCQSNPTPV